MSFVLAARSVFEMIGNPRSDLSCFAEGGAGVVAVLGALPMVRISKIAMRSGDDGRYLRAVAPEGPSLSIYIFALLAPPTIVNRNIAIVILAIAVSYHFLALLRSGFDARRAGELLDAAFAKALEEGKDLSQDAWGSFSSAIFGAFRIFAIASILAAIGYAASRMGVIDPSSSRNFLIFLAEVSVVALVASGGVIWNEGLGDHKGKFAALLAPALGAYLTLIFLETAVGGCLTVPLLIVTIAYTLGVIILHSRDLRSTL